MQLDVADFAARRARHGLRCTKLVAHDIAEGFMTQIDPPTAKALQVGKAGMRADPDLARHSPRHRSGHHIRIARVEAAGDIDGTDHVQQRRIVAHGPGPEALAHVRVEIDRFPHGSELLVMAGCGTAHQLIGQKIADVMRVAQ
mgnify:CR=1 FL=1